MREFTERHFGVLMLMLLLFILIAAHAFMIHAGRPHEMVTWVETLISSIFAALLPILAAKKDS